MTRTGRPLPPARGRPGTTRLWLRAGLALALLIVLQALAVRGGGDAAPALSLAAHVRRGDEVEARYQAHRERLERFFEALRAVIEAEAPDLRARLEPPAPVPYGYQILPKLVPDLPPRDAPTRPVSSPFSWSRSE